MILSDTTVSVEVGRDVILSRMKIQERVSGVVFRSFIFTTAHISKKTRSIFWGKLQGRNDAKIWPYSWIFWYDIFLLCSPSSLLWKEGIMGGGGGSSVPTPNILKRLSTRRGNKTSKISKRLTKKCFSCYMTWIYCLRYNTYINVWA